MFANNYARSADKLNSCLAIRGMTISLIPRPCLFYKASYVALQQTLLALCLMEAIELWWVIKPLRSTRPVYCLVRRWRLLCIMSLYLRIVAMHGELARYRWIGWVRRWLDNSVMMFNIKFIQYPYYLIYPDDEVYLYNLSIL